jgi:tRNA (guanine37-N1)-methyltransferase
MLFRIFTLHPDIFSSFWNNSLIARGVAKDIISYEMINWRDEFGVGGYKQIDDKPFGGGSGMVLQVEPIYGALQKYSSLSLLENNTKTIFPRNSDFEDLINNGNITKSVTIHLTPRGFRYNQRIAEWLAANFTTINIICGRYEGFDDRINSFVDLELSIGDYVLNGGETAAMVITESIARLVPEFITKDTSVLHDSFSSSLNIYPEVEDYGKRNVPKSKQQKNTKLFDNQNWRENILPHIEHPQYTRPEVWQGKIVPEVLLSGNHDKIASYRLKWHTQDSQLRDLQ